MITFSDLPFCYSRRFKHYQILILIPVMVNNEGPFNFGLDTGGYGGLDPSLVDKLELEQLKDQVTVDSFTIGYIHLDGPFTIPILDLSIINKEMDVKEDGVFGKVCFFDNLLVNIDYPSKTVEIVCVFR